MVQLNNLIFFFFSFFYGPVPDPSCFVRAKVHMGERAVQCLETQDRSREFTSLVLYVVSCRGSRFNVLASVEKIFGLELGMDPTSLTLVFLFMLWGRTSFSSE